MKENQGRKEFYLLADAACPILFLMHCPHHLQMNKLWLYKPAKVRKHLTAEHEDQLAMWFIKINEPLETWA